MQVRKDPWEQGVFDSVMVVGAGIAGIQATLDLAEAGHQVYLVERAPYVGGMMVRLDKTFPTNDCSVCTVAPRGCFLCIRSPRFIDYGGELKVDVLAGAELVALTGGPGNFTAEVREAPRYVDAQRCTACGKCAEVCPVEVPDEFNEGLSKRKAIFRPHPQSYPNNYVVDTAACDRCGKCVEVCPEECIDLEAAADTVQLHVGAVILAPGFEPYRPLKARHLGYKVHPDVITSVEFERMISASGPHGGQLRKPSDGQVPQRIAWVQCVGSRDLASGNGYCSSICCMYALKQAMLARDMLGEGTSGTIFGMDARVYGKGFDRYFERARTEYGIQFVKSRVYEVETFGDKPSIRYAPRAGVVQRDDFDLVVLSVGMCSPSEGPKLARAAGVELNAYGFCRTPDLAPAATTRPGVFVAGSFAGPKDVPDTVAEGSAAAAAAMALLGGRRDDGWRSVEVPRERPAAGPTPRIGVVLCECSGLVSGPLALAKAGDYVAGLADVAWVRSIDRVCSPAGQAQMYEVLQESDVDRVVVGACSSRNYERLFRDVLRETGLNPYMLEVANLLEHCALVHSPGPAAEAKAKDLLRMAVARARRLEPLAPSVGEVPPAALVVGGGIAGLTSAWLLLSQGHEVYIVEKDARLGGLAARVESALDGFSPRAYVEGLAKRVAAHPNARLLMESTLESLVEAPGAYKATVQAGPEGVSTELKVGAVILATGGDEYQPREYLYGEDPRVVTALQFEAMLSRDDPAVRSARTVAFLQCVGSRCAERRYCSRICCSNTIKSALKVKERDPETDVFVLYRDVMAYGLAEDYYRQARQQGVLFLRWEEDDPPALTAVPTAEGAAALQLAVNDPALGRQVIVEPDLVVLAAATVPNADNARLAGILGVGLNEDGFFQEAHPKLRPVEFDRKALFVCGLASSPKSAREQVAQAAAAAAKAAAILAKSRWSGGAEVAVVEGDCAGCLTCARVCPYGAPDVSSGKSRIDPLVCRGCGVCTAMCPAEAIRLLNCRSEQLVAQVDAWLGGVK